jgi:sodium/bile acid cotransporter 7
MTFSQILLLSSGLFVLFVLVLFLMQTVTRVLKFNRQDRITVLFCGSKKSLVHGTVMAGILFEGSSLAGFLLLPVMLYHAIQLLAASALAKRMALSSTL